MTEVTYTKKDFTSEQEVRWCPGCGDYSILAAIQTVLPKTGKKKEDIVFISGIGCSSRFPYYMSTYGMHTIHGRAPALTTGVKLANKNLTTWIITGDGDGLSIGGNHLIHTIRRNLDTRLIIFNNEIYGLTKGQASPTSQKGLVTKTTPYGGVDRPFSPASITLGAEGTFFARTVDTDMKHMQEVLLKASEHKGTAVVEILQNCVIFNDGVHEDFTEKEKKDETTLRLEHGKPMIFGKDKNKGIILKGITPMVVEIGKDGITEKDILIHDEFVTDSTLAFLLSRFHYPEFPLPLGVLRRVSLPTLDDEIHKQIDEVTKKKGKKDKNIKDLLFDKSECWDVK